MPAMPEVYPLPVIVPNHEAFTDTFVSELKKVGENAESLHESAERAINLIDNYQREGVPVVAEQMWTVVICGESEDCETLSVSDSAMKFLKTHFGRATYFTVSEAIAVGRAVANHWACTDECDIDGDESHVVVAVVQGTCGNEPDIKALNNQWEWILTAECEAGFCGSVESWVSPLS